MQKEITTKSDEVIKLTTENSIMDAKISLKNELIEDMKLHAKDLRINNNALQDKLVKIASRDNNIKSS